MKRQKRGHTTSTKIKPIRNSTTTSRFKPKLGSGIKKSTWILSSVAFFIILFVVIIFFSIKDDLQSFEKLERINPAIATQVYSADGEHLHSFFTANRAYTPFEKIPNNIVDALLSAEERGFYNHWGSESKGIAGALYN